MAKTPGEILRDARIEKNLSLEQIAAGTSIRVQYLQAIEEDRLGAIASQAQFKGFTRLYASFLGINPITLFETENSIGEVSQPQMEKTASQPISVEEESAEPKEPIISKLRFKESKKQIPIPPQEEESRKTPISDLIFQEIGAELKRQREALGLSLADVERQIKIREIYLYSLENGQIDGLPSSVQGRGMLNNYASFMNLNAEPLQMRFAEGLQQRRMELVVEDINQKKSNEVKKFGAPITGWRRYLTPDLLLGSSIFILLFVLVIWGAWQVIGSSRQKAAPTVDSISSILVGTHTLSAPINATSSSNETIEVSDASMSTVSVDLMATITSIGSTPIQVVIVAYQRAYLKVVSDGKDVFVGRTVPGNVYTYTGTEKITLTTGNAEALQVYYNQNDLGVLGVYGQVVNLEFLTDGMVTPTPKFTASPTATKPATLTPQPTNTPRPTAITPTVKVAPTHTITPLKP